MNRVFVVGSEFNVITRNNVHQQAKEDHLCSSHVASCPRDTFSISLTNLMKMRSKEG